MSTQSVLVSAMKGFANDRIKAAEALREIAENIEAMPEDQFNEQVGAEYAAVGWAAQILEQVEETAKARPGQQWAVNRALMDAVVKAQRADAAEADA